MVRGKAHCEWKVYISGDRRIIKDDQYFIDERTIIWESRPPSPSAAGATRDVDGQAKEEEEEQENHKELEEGDKEVDEEEREESLLREGFHEFHFSFQLPQKNLPCSLESRACCIRYHLRAILDIIHPSSLCTASPSASATSPCAEIPQGVKYFTVIGPLVDCNDNKYLVSGWVWEFSPLVSDPSVSLLPQNPLFGSEKRWRFCFCCRQQTASLRCILDRSAFCSGETIRLKSLIQNNSTETVKLKVRLVQVSEW